MVISMLFHFGPLDLIINWTKMNECQALTHDIAHARFSGLSRIVSRKKVSVN